ncbi:hypothetical protein KQI68_06740 [Peptoniphilus sp. MSJ-1]|uniref:Uncharacterized protein n=1 Tax=Peptoniphilus ovalis TaxID=2841503 RepID=A0ABS6FH90_9FIRM|nr:hypothetical protein [Peptoniphilus ovalis]MBU5669535.1 hypothetical protein [Peptoniphilus ovalis]
MQDKEIVTVNGEVFDKKSLNEAIKKEREKLTRLVRLSKYIEGKESLEEELRELNGSIGAIDYSKDRVQTSNLSGFEKLSDKLMDLEQDLKGKKFEYILAKNELIEKLIYIKSMQAKVLELRYLEMLDINDIAGEVDRTASRVRILLKEGVLQLAINNLRGI